MKKYILLILLMAAHISVVAQNQKPKPSPPFPVEKDLISFGFGGGNKGVLGEAGLRKNLHKNGLVLVMAVQLNDLRPANTPVDYDPGSSLLGKKPDVRVDNVLLPIHIAKEFYTKSRRSCISAEVGPSLNLHQIATFTPVYQVRGWLGRGSNYSVDRKSRIAPGASARLSFTVMASPKVAMQFSGIGNFNKYQNFLGGMINILVPLK